MNVEKQRKMMIILKIKGVIGVEGNRQIGC